MALQKCPDCGGSVSKSAPMCPHCGYGVQEFSPQQPTVVYVNEGSNSNMVAGIASLFIPGLGQAFHGQYLNGILHFAIACVMWPLTLFMFGWIVNVCSAVGAARYKPRR